ncbi:MAG: serine/threonine protein kinase [Planctomycetes bacterium]|nr:serine/threonine protein kinase [Planctomycetota bacterium]
MDSSKDETVDLRPSGARANPGVDAASEKAPEPSAAAKDARGPERATAMSIAELLLLGMDEGGRKLKSEDSGRWIGKLIGDYRLDQELGRGGMGIVFKATNVRVGSTVALKLLRFAPGETAERLRRFETEARAAAALNHPNIINVFDVGQVGDLYYLAMEYIEGQPLSDKIAVGPLDPLQAVRITMDVCNALEFAHEAGVIHRDIKPSNILIEPSGRAQIMDFGLARSVNREGAAKKLTEEGSILGTVYYMSPEQALGHGHQADSRSDIYSVGAVLYEMLTGLPPFDGETPLEIVRKVAQEEPPPPRKLRSAVDRDLEIIVLKAMEKDPRRRYVSAAAMREDLWRYHSGEPIMARPPSPFYRTGKYLRRNRDWTIPAGLSILAVLAMAVGFLLHDRTLRRNFEDEAQQRQADMQERVRRKLLELEAEELNDPARERWRMVHALRLSGHPQAALAELDRPPPAAPPAGGKAFEELLWRAILMREAGLPGDGEAFAKAQGYAKARQQAADAAIVDLYLNPAAATEPPDNSDAECARYFYHKGHAARLRGEMATAAENFRKAAACSPGLLETRCAALEAQALEAPDK